MKRLVVIDGKSVFYRGYYAMPGLSLADGTPTGGIYGFAAIAMEIVNRLKPSKVVVAWDSKTSTIKRKAIFADYKAGRVKPGDDFYIQIPLLKELISDLGWSFVEVDEYEADDIIGTLSKEADEAGDYETYIVSSDLDMLQIVDENTRMYRILKGFSEIEEIDVVEFEHKYGIKQAQFLDLKALKGDSSDNIPGVPGIGEKTAVKLLNEYETLDGIYEHIEEIAGATHKKLVAGKESAYMSQKLAEIMFDAPVKLEEVPEFRFDSERVAEGLKKLRFNSLIKKFKLDYQENEEVFIDNSKPSYQQLDQQLEPVLRKMERKGMLIDREYFARLKIEFEEKVRGIEQKICSMAGVTFNVNSPVQLSEILFTRLELPVKGIKKTTRGYSTGASELEKLKGLHPIIPLIMEYREAAKLLNTYIIPLPELADTESRVHTTFTQDVTATGRLSSVNPNLQNIPVRTEEGKRIREGFVAPEGKVLVNADYSQFELRLAAAMANDEALIADFNAGIDIHTKTAAEAFGVPFDQVTKQQRRAAKVINFGVLYGMSAKGLADAADMSVAEAKAFIDRYFELRAPIRRKLDEYLAQARELGYVETLFGRRRMTPDVKSPNFLIRTAAERAAQNMPIQGTEADLMKRAMIKIDEKLPDGAEMVMQVHDSLIVECDESQAQEVKEILQDIMEKIAPELKVKLAVEVVAGKNWGEI